MRETTYCPQCQEEYEIFDSTSMSYCYDQEFNFWFIHWIVQPFEYCIACEAEGGILEIDEFDTPADPETMDMETWRRWQQKQQGALNAN